MSCYPCGTNKKKVKPFHCQVKTRKLILFKYGPLMWAGLLVKSTILFSLVLLFCYSRKRWAWMKHSIKIYFCLCVRDRKNEKHSLVVCLTFQYFLVYFVFIWKVWKLRFLIIFLIMHLNYKVVVCLFYIFQNTFHVQGRGGSKIRELQEESNASIKVRLCVLVLEVLSYLCICIRDVRKGIEQNSVNVSLSISLLVSVAEASAQSKCNCWLFCAPDHGGLPSSWFDFVS